MKLIGQQTQELKPNQVSQKTKKFRQGMWIKTKNKTICQTLSDSKK